MHGPDIAPDGANPERADYRQVILRERLLAALARINPHIPTVALEQAAHVMQTISEPQAVVRNRSFHRLLLLGVAVEFTPPHPQPRQRERGIFPLPRVRGRG